MTQKPDSFPEFNREGPSDNNVASGRPRFNTSPLVVRVNVAVISLPERIALFEQQRASHLQSLGGSALDGYDKYIHINALVDAILDFCGSIFMGVTEPQDSLALAKTVIPNVSEAYRQQIQHILLLFATYSNNPRGLHDVRDVVFNLLNPQNPSELEDTPIFIGIPESAPNAGISIDLNTQSKKKTPFKSPPNSVEDFKSVAEKAANEYFDSLRKGRTQLKMATDFSEMLRIGIQTHRIFLKGSDGKSALRFCEILLSKINRENHSSVVLESTEHPLSELLMSIVTELQARIEAGDRAAELNRDWYAIAGYATILPVALSVSHDTESPILHIEAGVADTESTKPSITQPRHNEGNNAFNPAHAALPNTRVALKRVEPANVEPETIDAGDAEHFVPFGTYDEDVGSVPFADEPTPVEDSGATRQAVILKYLASSRENVVDLCARADTAFETARALIIQESKGFRMTPLLKRANHILHAAAVVVTKVEKLRDIFNQIVGMHEERESLVLLGELQIGFEEVESQLASINQSLQEYKIEFVRRSQRNRIKGFLNKVAPYIFAAGSAFFSTSDSGRTDASQDTQTDQYEQIVTPEIEQNVDIHDTVEMRPTQPTPIIDAPIHLDTPSNIAHATHEAINSGELQIESHSAHQRPIIHAQVDAQHGQSETIVTLEKGEGLSQSALRLHTSLVTEKVINMLQAQGHTVEKTKIDRAVKEHIASLKGAQSFSLAMSYIGSTELNDPLMNQFDTTTVNGKPVVNPLGNVNDQAKGNSYAVDTHNTAVASEVSASADKIMQSLGTQSSTGKNFFNKAASKIGGFVKGLFR